MNTGALVVLSGRTPWKDDFDPQHMIGTLTDACRLVLTFGRAGIAPVVLVVGPRELEQEKELSKLGATILHGTNPAAEMFDHVKLGLEYLQDKCAAAFVTPVDIPLVTADTVRRLAQSQAAWTVPTFRGQSGHPVMIRRALFAQVLEYRGRDGLRGALSVGGNSPQLMQVEDTGVVLDVERADCTEELAKGHDLWKLHPDIRVCICREQMFWGPGTRRLLSLIDYLGSVREASQQMGVSYSKAWKMLKVLEEQIGYKVVDRQQGGRHGGEANLTGPGQVLLERFTAYEQECHAMAEEIFKRHFPEEL